MIAGQNPVILSLDVGGSPDSWRMFRDQMWMLVVAFKEVNVLFDDRTKFSVYLPTKALVRGRLSPQEKKQSINKE